MTEEKIEALAMIAEIEKFRIDALEHELNTVWILNVVMSAVVVVLAILRCVS